MKISFKCLAWLPVVIFSLFCFSGCGGSSGGTNAPDAPIEARITTDKTTYRVGEPVRATLTFRNLSTSEQTLRSGSSSFLRVSVTPVGQTEPISFFGNAGLGVITTIRLAPGQTKQESGTWNQTIIVNGQNNVQAPAGRYILRSALLQQTPPEKVRDVPLSITLVN
ncbi:MAG TPA: hypothetical protein VGB77_15545 [Abditibacteriaceae bacterium]|jgi:hypothetical protein